MVARTAAARAGAAGGRARVGHGNSLLRSGAHQSAILCRVAVRVVAGQPLLVDGYVLRSCPRERRRALRGIDPFEA